MKEKSEKNPKDYNFKEMTQVFLKKIRGQESQENLSFMMDYNFNVYSRWETGARGFYWDDFIRLGKAKNIPIGKILNSVIHSEFQQAPTAEELLTAMLPDSAKSVLESYFSSQKINRLKSGKSKLLFSDFLTLLEISFGRAQRFIGHIVETTELATATPEFTIFDQYLNILSKNARVGLLAYALNHKDYRALPQHSHEFLAKMFNLPIETIEESIRLMEEIGIIKKEGLHFTPTYSFVDTGSRGPQVSREVMKQFRTEILQQSQSEETRENVLGAYLAYGSNPELDRQVFEICKKFYMDIKNTVTQFDGHPTESLKYIGIDIYSLLGKDSK